VLSVREARRGSCVILFGKPDNPMGQPRSLVGGHLIGAPTPWLASVLFQRTFSGIPNTRRAR
jgi:CBS-domain-containing membrane protein